MPRKIDMVGAKIFKLRVLSQAGTDKRNEAIWRCICECGNEVMVLGNNLRRGGYKSCGCLNNERIGDLNRRHSMSKTRIYKIWAGIRKRCNNPNMTSYADYGGRGIKVCEEWGKFEDFYSDMAKGYEEHLTLDRIDANGDYTKENCKWSTMKDQARNKRNSVFIELDGSRKTVAEWEECSGTGRATITWRIKNGWGIRDAIYGRGKSSISDIEKYLIF